MSVHTQQHDRPAVHQESAVSHFDPSEADGESGGMQRPIEAIHQCDNDAIEPGGFCGPRLDSDAVKVERGDTPVVRVGSDQLIEWFTRRHRWHGRDSRRQLIIAIEQGGTDPIVVATTRVGLNVESTESGLGVVVGLGGYIVDPSQGTGFQKHAAMQPGMPPVILIFDPGGVAVTNHHDVDRVPASD